MNPIPDPQDHIAPQDHVADPPEARAGAEENSSGALARGPVLPVAPGGSALAQVLRRAGRDLLVLLAVVTVLGVGVGVVWKGMPGLWGALMGVGIAIVFSGTTVWTMLRTVHTPPVTTAAVVMGSWLGKMALLLIVLMVLRGQTFYDKWVFAVVLVAAVVGSALLDYRAVLRGRIPYVDADVTSTH